MAEVSEKSRLVALILCVFLGVMGVHRFYVGKIGTGILWLITGGILGIGALVDLVMIIIGSFTDKQEKKLENWTINNNKQLPVGNVDLNQTEVWPPYPPSPKRLPVGNVDLNQTEPDVEIVIKSRKMQEDDLEIELF